LPLHRNEAEWNTTAMLDGVPMPLEWRNDGRECAIHVPEPGQYSLAIYCLPKTTTGGTENQIALSIPPVRGAQIALRFPESASAPTISHASLLPMPVTSTGTLKGELERTDRLHIQWLPSDLPDTGKQGVSVTELRWLDIKPADTELTIKYIVEGAGRRPDSLTISYDDRWKLLSSVGSTATDHVDSNSCGRRILRVPIPTQPTDRPEVKLRWRLADPISIGNFRLPQVELTTVSTSKRWLALSVDPVWECELADSSAMEGMADEFLSMWGASDASFTPQLVFSNFDFDHPWTVAIRPGETEPIVNEAIEVAAGLSALRVKYEAKIAPGNVGTYGMELSVPANLSIDEITASADDAIIPSRWSRSAANRVNVFFGKQITEPCRLVVQGKTPVAAAGTADLPRISTLATEAMTRKMRLYRDDDVHVDLQGISLSTDSDTESTDPPPSKWRMRPIGLCYLDTNSTTAAHILVRPNDIKLSGNTLTALTRENGAWVMNYRCQLTVEKGELDVLRMRIPNDCTAPFDVQSALPISTEVKRIDEHSSLLLVRFDTAVAKGGSIDVRISSPLKSSAGMEIAVPSIVPEALTHGHRFVSVPDLGDSQRLSWAVTGTHPASVPPKLLVGFTVPTPAHSFEIVGSTFKVVSQPQAAPTIPPQIRLADTVVVVGETNAQLIATRLILAPHGLNECTVQLPKEQQLVSLRINGQPTLIRRLDEAQWQIGLGPAQLPQFVEIVARSPLKNMRSSTILRRPTLFAYGQPIPTEMSLWSFAHPSKSATRIVHGADQLSAIEQAALRLDRLVSIAESAQATAAELPSPDGYNWFQPWAQLLATARAQAQQTTAVRRSNSVQSQVSHTTEDQIGQAAGRLDKWLADCRKSLARPNSGETATETSSDNPVASLLSDPAAGEWTYYVAEGGKEQLNLELRPLAPTAAQTRLFGLLLIAAILVAVVGLMRWPAAMDFVNRWPHAFGILFGITYWAFLWPSWLGLVIAAIGLWLALRFDWPGRTLRTEASTVLRTARSSG
ncbi:MAG TPA: hypothetical protein VHE81_03560, partial [Lacipirellulaceae bacterium]|nr:hypothetical protein [Lacipirellulaceae bacterium]